MIQRGPDRRFLVSLLLMTISNSGHTQAPSNASTVATSGATVVEQVRMTTTAWADRNSIVFTPEVVEAVAAEIRVSSNVAITQYNVTEREVQRVLPEFLNGFYTRSESGRLPRGSVRTEFQKTLTGSSFTMGPVFRFVFVSIVLIPGDANLFLNGQRVHRSKANRYGVPEGELRVRATMAGYEPCEKRVSVSEADPPSIECLLARQP